MKKSFYFALFLLIVSLVFILYLSSFIFFKSFSVGDIVFRNSDSSVGYIKGIDLFDRSYLVDFGSGLENVEEENIKSITEISGKGNFSYQSKEIKIDFIPQKDSNDEGSDDSIALYDASEGTRGKAVFFGLGAIGFNQGSIEELNCNAEINCGDWSDCNPQYDLSEITQNTLLRGEKRRYCKDSTGCLPEFFEFVKCDLKENITVKVVMWCGKKYVELESENNQLTRIESAPDGLMVHLYDKEENYCPYCFNGIRDYDELGIDCGGGCKSCA